MAICRAHAENVSRKCNYKKRKAMMSRARSRSWKEFVKEYRGNMRAASSAYRRNARPLPQEPRKKKGSLGSMASLLEALPQASAPRGATWDPSMGLMEYAEVSMRDVQSGAVDLSKYERVKPEERYVWSQKMDGWHVVWDGRGKLYTKSGSRTFPAPASFLARLPKNVAVSGELVVRGKQATSVANLLSPDGPWAEAKLYAFDLPGERTMRFHARTTKLKAMVEAGCKKDDECPLRYIEQHVLVDAASFLSEFESIVSCRGPYARGASSGACLGEGVVVTDPNSLYVPGRCSVATRFKLKRREDAEGEVVGYNDGSLQVRFRDTTFSLGIGMTDEQRADMRAHFPRGSTVKFSFRALGEHGKPKEARLIGARHEADMRALAKLSSKRR